MTRESWIGMALLVFGLALLFAAFVPRKRGGNVSADRKGVAIKGNFSGIVNTGEINSSAGSNWERLLSIAGAIVGIIGFLMMIWPSHQ